MIAYDIVGNDIARLGVECVGIDTKTDVVRKRMLAEMSIGYAVFGKYLDGGRLNSLETDVAVTSELYL